MFMKVSFLKVVGIRRRVSEPYSPPPSKESHDKLFFHYRSARLDVPFDDQRQAPDLVARDRLWILNRASAVAASFLVSWDVEKRTGDVEFPA